MDIKKNENFFNFIDCDLVYTLLVLKKSFISFAKSKSAIQLSISLINVTFLKKMRLLFRCDNSTNFCFVNN